MPLERPALRIGGYPTRTEWITAPVYFVPRLVHVDIPAYDSLWCETPIAPLIVVKGACSNCKIGPCGQPLTGLFATRVVRAGPGLGPTCCLRLVETSSGRIANTGRHY